MRGLGEKEHEREEPHGGESEERLEREETGGNAEERVAAAARGHREVERRSGGRCNTPVLCKHLGTANHAYYASSSIIIIHA